MNKYYCIAIAAAMLTALGQILLKIGALRWKSGNILRLYLNPWILCGYFVLWGVTLLSLYVFKYIPLKSAVFLMPLTLFGVVIASRWIFHEKLSRATILGAVIVVLGVAIFNL